MSGHVKTCALQGSNLGKFNRRTQIKAQPVQVHLQTTQGMSKFSAPLACHVILVLFKQCFRQSAAKDLCSTTLSIIQYRKLVNIKLTTD